MKLSSIKVLRSRAEDALLGISMRTFLLLIPLMFCLYIFLMFLHDIFNSGDENRDTIKFKNSFKEVRTCINRMNVLLDKSLIDSNEIRNYFFDADSNFFVNSRNVGRLNYSNIDTTTILQNLSRDEKIDFMKSIFFLRNNHLSSAYKNSSCDCYLYDYQSFYPMTLNQSRYIYMEEENKNYSTLFIDRRIIDSVEKIKLIGNTSHN